MALEVTIPPAQVVGFTGSVNSAQWAKLHDAMASINYKHGVLSGMVTAIVAAVREVSVSAGVAYLPGLRIEGGGNLTFNANTSGATRVDYVVLEANWATSTVKLKVVTGTSGVPPVLTQVAGELWQMPLARVSVRNAVTTFIASDIVVCKPLERKSYVYEGAFTNYTFTAPVENVTMSALNVADPGWPYRLRATGALRAQAEVGFARLHVTIDGVNPFAYGLSPQLGEYLGPANPSKPIIVNGLSPVVSGAPLVRLWLNTYGVAAGTQLIVEASTANIFQLEQIPA